MSQLSIFLNYSLLGAFAFSIPVIAETEAAPRDEVAVASKKSDVRDEKSPNFPMGKMTRPNLILHSKDDPNMAIFAGIRMQGTAELTKSGTRYTSDFYGRRVRFEFGAQFSKDMSFNTPIRGLS